MRMYRLAPIVLAAGLVTTACQAHSAPAHRPLSPLQRDMSRLRLPPGWTARVWARVPDARMEAWTPSGSLLVSQPLLGKVVELTPTRHPPRWRVVLACLNQ